MLATPSYFYVLWNEKEKTDEEIEIEKELRKYFLCINIHG